MSLSAFARKHSLNALTGLLFALAVWRLGFTAELPAVLAFIFGGVLLAVIDWRFQRLPTVLVYYTGAGVAAGLVFASLVTWDWVPIVSAIAGAVLLTNAFFLILLIGRNWAGMAVFGMGDVRLAAVLGLMLGWYGLPYVLYGAVAGNLLAVLMAMAISIKKRQVLLRYSFGPPLIAGTLGVILFRV